MTDRRTVVRALASCAAAVWAAPVAAAACAALSDDASAAITLRIGSQRLATVPADFMGLGYEISSAARAGLLSARNHHYVELVRTLGAQGVVRVGGNTSDDASYSAEGASRSAPIGTVVNRENLEELGGFLRATGWRLLWGLNLGTGTEDAAVEEALAVHRAAGDHLLGFEIGNEPDLFSKNPKHRSPRFGYDEYLRDFREYRAAIRRRLPGAAFAGPDAADHTEWVERFAADEGRGLTLLTHHYYRECESPASTTEKLLHPDPKLLPQLERLQKTSRVSGVPYRICEVNSFCGGGRPGVSDTFGAALWVLDYLCLLASHGCAGVNLQTGVNQRGFVSSYSPIGEDEDGRYSAAPEFYGMLAFRVAGGGDMLPVMWNPGEANATAYAFRSPAGETRVVLVNKDEAAAVRVRLPGRVRDVLRLEAPALNSKTGVTLGGRAVSADGRWPARQTRVNSEGAPDPGVFTVSPASAAVVLLG